MSFHDLGLSSEIVESAKQILEAARMNQQQYERNLRPVKGNPYKEQTEKDRTLKISWHDALQMFPLNTVERSRIFLDWRSQGNPDKDKRAKLSAGTVAILKNRGWAV